MARVIDTRDSAAGVHEFSISFLCRSGQYTDMLRILPPGEEYGMSSTPETGCMACTSAVSRFSTPQGSIPMCYRAGESNLEITAVSAHKSHCANISTDFTLSVSKGGHKHTGLKSLLSANEGRRRACYGAFWAQICKETEKRKEKSKIK